MARLLPIALVNSFTSFRDDVSQGIQEIPLQLAALDRTLGTFSGAGAVIIEKSGRAFGRIFKPAGLQITSVCLKTINKTINFIRDSWKQLLAYIFAWGVVIACTGLMYGFHAVAFPFAIGMGCGFIFGGITGILTVTVFDDKKKKDFGIENQVVSDVRNKTVKINTLWDLLNHGIEQLDPNGTRQIFLAVAVTVILAASVVFPYVIGALFGIFIGNQLVTKAGQGRRLGKNPEKIKHQRENLKLAVTKLEGKVDDLKRRIDQCQTRVLTAEFEKLLANVEILKSKLNEHEDAQID